MRYILPLLLASCLLVSGCYHAQVTTGKEASNTVVEERWAPAYLHGLVPARIDVSQECPAGIASAERELTFLNMLVSGLTLSIYSPQHVTVTCAAEGEMTDAMGIKGFTLPSDGTDAEIRDVLGAASMQSALTQKPVQVRVTNE